MSVLTPRQLADQLRKSVEVLAAPAKRQTEFINSDSFPVPPDDLLLQLDAAVPAWLPTLLDAGVIDAEVGASLEALLSYLISTPRSLWRDDEAVFDEPGWEDVRRRADPVLAAFDAGLQRFDAAREGRTDAE